MVAKHSAGSKKKRVPMKNWLIDQLNSNYYPTIINWVDKKNKIFKIRWLHASTETWSSNHALIFKAWSMYTGKYDPANEEPRKWKANFRCALNSLTGVKRKQELSVKKGKDAIRVFQILDDSETSKPCSQRLSPQPYDPSSQWIPGDSPISPADSSSVSSYSDNLDSSEMSDEGIVDMLLDIADAMETPGQSPTPYQATPSFPVSPDNRELQCQGSMHHPNEAEQILTDDYGQTFLNLGQPLARHF